MEEKYKLYINLPKQMVKLELLTQTIKKMEKEIKTHIDTSSQMSSFGFGFF